MKARLVESVVFAGALGAVGLLAGTGCGGARTDGATPPGTSARASDDPAQPEPPARVYLSFVRALAKASAIEELAPYLALTARSNLKRLSPDGRADRLVIARREMPADVKVASETIDGEKATLKVSGTKDGKPERGTATLVRELGLWKLANEAWE